MTTEQVLGTLWQAWSKNPNVPFDKSAAKLDCSGVSIQAWNQFLDELPLSSCKTCSGTLNNGSCSCVAQMNDLSRLKS